MLSKDQLELAKTNPKKFLLQYNDLSIRIKRILSEMEFEEEAGASSDRMQNLLSEAKKAKAEREEIYNLVNNLPIDETYKYILTSHYLNGKTVCEIANELKYTCRWTSRLQAKSLKAFSDAI